MRGYKKSTQNSESPLRTSREKKIQINLLPLPLCLPPPLFLSLGSYAPSLPALSLLPPLYLVPPQPYFMFQRYLQSYRKVCMVESWGPQATPMPVSQFPGSAELSDNYSPNPVLTNHLTIVTLMTPRQNQQQCGM